MLKFKCIITLLALVPFGIQANTLLDSRLKDFYRDLETRNLPIKHQVKSLMSDTVTYEGRQKIKRFLSNAAMNLRDMPMSYADRSAVGQHLSQIGQAIQDTQKYAAPRPKVLVSSGEGEVAENIQIRIPKAQPVALQVEATKTVETQVDTVATSTPPVKEQPKLEEIVLAEQMPEKKIDTISNMAAATKKVRKQDSIWFEVAGWSAALLAMLAFGVVILRKIVQARQNAQKVSKRARIQNKRYSFFNEQLSMLVDAPTSFVVISDKDEVCWSNKAATQNFNWKMGSKISNIVRNLENVANDTYEMNHGNGTWIVQMKSISLKSARAFRLLTIVNAGPFQHAGNNYSIDNNFAQNGSELRSLLEQVLERKAYLFHVSGVTLNFADFPSSQIVPARSMTAVIENTLHAIHLMLKDHQGMKDITIRGVNRGERIGLSFTIKDYVITQDVLKQVNVYPGKRAENAATVFRRNEMILSPARGRVLISQHKDAQGSINSEIEIWMNRIGAAKARDSLPPLPN